MFHLTKMDSIIILFTLNLFCISNAFNYFDPSATSELFTRFFYKLSPSNTDFVSFRQVRKVHKRQSVVCNENTLMLNLATLEIKSPDRIISLATGGDFYEYCQRIKKNLGVTDALLKNCVPMERDNNLYIRLINGTRVFHNLSCSIDAKYWKILDKHMPCLTQLHEEFLECEGPDDWYEELRTACDNYESILKCNYIKVGELCGVEAANVINSVAKEVFDVILPKNLKCEINIESGLVPEAFKTSHGTKNHSKNTLLYLLLSFFVSVMSQ